MVRCALQGACCRTSGVEGLGLVVPADTFGPMLRVFQLLDGCPIPSTLFLIVLWCELSCFSP